MRIGTRLGSLSEACLALLLLPILRGLSVFQLLGIQFEASVRYHIWLGNGMMLFSTLHGLITMFVWGVKHKLGYELVQWQLTGRVNLAGEISLAVGVIIWITSLPQIRRKWFELFYYTHHLYLVFIIFFLFHAGDRHFYTVLSGVILFALDKLLRVIQSRQVTSLISARLLPCTALELTLSKHPGLEYSPTSVIFINVPSISVLQWHPFSLTSSPSVDKDTISVLIKCQGQWTNELYRKVHEATNLEASIITMNLPVAVEGPYGPSSIYYQRYDGLLLIAGGIGITPFISILREIYLNGSDNNSLNKCTTRVQLIYVVKKTQDLSMLNSVSALFLDKSTNKGHLKLKIYVTQEEKSSTNLRDQLQELSQVQTLFFDTTHSKYSMPSPESYLWKAAIAGIFSIIFMASFMCLNHAFLRPEKPSSKKKNPSWISDLIIIFSFTIATVCSTSILLLLRWRKRKNEILLSQKQAKGTELQSIAEQGSLEENEIYFGQRPDFQDIFSKFSTNMGRSEIGVLVSGPESMQESVACCCRQHSRNFNIDSKVKGASFSYNSLSFSL